MSYLNQWHNKKLYEYLQLILVHLKLAKDTVTEWHKVQSLNGKNCKQQITLPVTGSTNEEKGRACFTSVDFEAKTVLSI